MKRGLLLRKWDQLSAHIDARMNGTHERRADAGAGADGNGVYVQQAGMAPRLLAGLLIVTAILMLIFVAASTIVRGFSQTQHGVTRTMIEQQASADYRKARARCQRLESTARDACIADAHAAEQRARALGHVAFRDYLASLRGQREDAINAADRDSIVIEPACNVVARGQGSLCEIQLKRGVEVTGTNLIPATMKTTLADYQAKALRARPSVVKPRIETVGPTEPVKVSAVDGPRDGHIFDLAWASRQ